MTRYYSKADIATTVFRAIKRLILSGGLEAVTIRSVAKEAETSTGALRNRWADKSALVQEACSAVRDDLGRATLRRVSTMVARSAPEGADRDRLEEAVGHLAATLPYDDATREDMTVWWAFRARARWADDAVRRMVTDFEDSWLEVCRMALRHLGLDDDRVEDEALRLHLLMIGLRTRLCDPCGFTDEQALTVLRAHLAPLAAAG